MTNGNTRSISLCRRSLLRIVLRSPVRRLFVFSLVFASVFGGLAAAKRISPAEAVLSLLAAAAVFVAVHAPNIEVLLTLHRILNRIPDFDVLAQGKSLTFASGKWQYADELLLVDADETSACILYAPQIDFSKKMRIETRTWTVIHGHGYARHLLFHDQDGKLWSMRVLPSEGLRAWIIAHGGEL